MTKELPIQYWDSCIYITLLEQDMRDRELYDGIHMAAKAFDGGECLLVASLLIQLEARRSRMKTGAAARFTAMMEHPNILIADVDSRIVQIADKILEHGYSNSCAVQPMDALHLATAVHFNAGCFYTNDAALLRLTGGISGLLPNNIMRPPLA